VSLVDRNSHAHTRVHTRSCVRCTCTCNAPRFGGSPGIIVTLKWVVGDPEPERRTKVMLRRGFRALSSFHASVAYCVAIAQSRLREYADGIFIETSACGGKMKERERERERGREREQHPRVREVPSGAGTVSFFTFRSAAYIPRLSAHLRETILIGPKEG